MEPVNKDGALLLKQMKEIQKENRRLVDASRRLIANAAMITKQGKAKEAQRAKRRNEN